MGQELDAVAVFLIHTLKQVLYGFDRLDSIADEVNPGSAAMAFYLSSIYNYIALLFLLDKKDKSMGGSVYRTLKPFGLEGLLDPIRATLEEPLGSVTLGEVIRVFRNTAIVHPTHSDADLDRVYAAIDMNAMENQQLWQDLMHRLRDDIKMLSLAIARSTGRPLSDFGFRGG
ncbi:MAG: hypothetical protein AMJ94_07205 [Deltaproteobacteria bacterium SM23_61]|nr:MAG: hypothetical protein AMJ94_07205 [Deltaproteobacteria bacterium SM23_61]